MPPSPFAPLWPLDPAVLHLNHGSFGACPVAVLDFQRALREELERQPTDFMIRSLPARLAETRAALGAFVGAAPDDLAFVANATSGVNAVLRSLELRAGDELLTTEHSYGACRKALEYVARRADARVVTVPLPFPLADAGELVEPVLAAVTPRTRLALLDHVTSPTALVVPLERLVPALRQRGVETMVDGAHALGMLPLELDLLGAAFYTANAHKWLCAPKGAAILHVRRDVQRLVHPLTISHGYEPQADAALFRAEWDWTGTLDPTAWLAMPECIRFLGAQLPGGWPELYRRNHALALLARQRVASALGVALPCPEDRVGAMASLPLPAAAAGSPAARLDADVLADWTRERGVESWFCAWPSAPGGKLVRLSAQLYNDEGEYARLAELLVEALGGG
jgi:isopenicillin-N epimerase